LPKPFALSKRLALLSCVLAGISGAAYGLRPPPQSTDGQATTVSAATDSFVAPNIRRPQPVRRIMDEVGFLDETDALGLDGYLSGINVESGVDIRFIFTGQVRGDLESFALKRARELGLGRNMNKRSLLFVYDVAGQRMRIEVGPGMEGMFPDGFLGYLTREQTAALFASGNRHLALKSTLNVVSHRLREAALGGTYDPRAVAYITDPVRLAAGGGATARAPVGDYGGPVGGLIATADARAHFGPQPTVADAFARYLEALRDGHYEPDLPLYTDQTQSLFRILRIARPFAEFIVYAEYGHKYTIVEHGDLAILYLTNTPLVSAHLFRRFPDGWRLDIAAEVEDTREFVGGPYTWGMMLTGDDYTRAFSDLYADYGALRLARRSGYRPMPLRVLRPARGDNRPLPTRNGYAAMPVRIRHVGERSLLLPLVATNTEDFGYPTQTIDRLAVRRLLISRSYDTLNAVLSAYADSAVRDYRIEYRLFDAYAAFDVAIPSLEPLLTEWVKQRPTSAAALLARGTYLSAAGWDARGREFAGKTKRRQFDHMTDFFRRASSDFHAALRISPGSIVAYRALITITATEGDPAIARQLLDQALKIQPYSFRLRFTYMENILPRWGGSYEAMTQFAEESMPYAARNLRIRALLGFVDWDRGRVLEREGNNPEAIKAYERALRFGDFWEFRYQRGSLYFRANQNTQALADLNSVLVQYPQNADALYERSWVNYDLAFTATEEAKVAYFAQAFDDIEMSVALDPTDQDHQKHLAFIRENIPEYAPPPPL
jgi:uncharacterized protein